MPPLNALKGKHHHFLVMESDLTKKRNSKSSQSDKNSLLSFNPTRRDVLKWSAVTGACGGLLMIQAQVIWQIIGVFIVVFVSNYHISKAARHMPRWQATIIAFVGVLAAMFGVIIIGALVIAYFQPVES